MFVVKNQEKDEEEGESESEKKNNLSPKPQSLKFNNTKNGFVQLPSSLAVLPPQKPPEIFFLSHPMSLPPPKPPYFKSLLEEILAPPAPPPNPPERSFSTMPPPPPKPPDWRLLRSTVSFKAMPDFKPMLSRPPAEPPDLKSPLDTLLPVLPPPAKPPDKVSSTLLVPPTLA
ncbi:hypothetical protein TSUD_33270 [Trifolium subterraneum]|uniref:Uncharacterized protein n=1 Tax=Trifolium subterraneum TaxID=3900 RepID=A0A2Z6MDR4_TRISU|nr:hypothetical protein TSUD_33270 [Trifolium subterraneum]